MLSARNQILATVTNIDRGIVNGIVTVEFNVYTAKCDITNDAIDELNLKPGMKVAILIKASDVMFAPGDKADPRLSTSNQFPGVITKLERGAINARIVLTLKGGSTISGSITDDAVDEYGFDEGQPAVAIVNTFDLMTSTID